MLLKCQNLKVYKCSQLCISGVSINRGQLQWNKVENVRNFFSCIFIKKKPNKQKTPPQQNTKTKNPNPKNKLTENMTSSTMISLIWTQITQERLLKSLQREPRTSFIHTTYHELQNLQGFAQAQVVFHVLWKQEWLLKDSGMNLKTFVN